MTEEEKRQVLSDEYETLRKEAEVMKNVHLTEEKEQEDVIAFMEGRK